MELDHALRGIEASERALRATRRRLVSQVHYTPARCEAFPTEARRLFRDGQLELDASAKRAVLRGLLRQNRAEEAHEFTDEVHVVDEDDGDLFALMDAFEWDRPAARALRGDEDPQDLAHWALLLAVDGGDDPPIGAAREVLGYLGLDGALLLETPPLGGFDARDAEQAVRVLEVLFRMRGEASLLRKLVDREPPLLATADGLGAALRLAVDFGHLCLFSAILRTRGALVAVDEIDVLDLLTQTKLWDRDPARVPHFLRVYLQHALRSFGPRTRAMLGREDAAARVLSMMMWTEFTEDCEAAVRGCDLLEEHVLSDICAVQRGRRARFADPEAAVHAIVTLTDLTHLTDRIAAAVDAEVRNNWGALSCTGLDVGPMVRCAALAFTPQPALLALARTLVSRGADCEDWEAVRAAVVEAGADWLLRGGDLAL